MRVQPVEIAQAKVGPPKEPPKEPRKVKRVRGRERFHFVDEVTDEFVRELHTMLSTLVERAPLFADLRSRGLAEDLVQETLIAITRRIEKGHAIEQPFTYAQRSVENLARRSYIRGRETAIGNDAIEVMAPPVSDVADHVEQRLVMSEVLDMVRTVNAVVATLPPLDLELVRAELARTDQKKLAARLGISRPTLYRRKGPAITAFVAAVAERAGTRPCPEYAGALLAAAGESGFDAARAAGDHAKSCEECAATVRHLAVARHGLAIIAPIPLAGTADPARAVERGHAWLEGVADWVRNIVTRVGDPMPLGGSATKTVAIVAAACTGGGGFYCAVDGVPSQLKAPFAHADKPRASAPKPVRLARNTPTPAGTFVATSAALRQVAATVSAVNHDEADRRAAARRRKAQAAAAEKRRRERAAAAARRKREQAQREFAASAARSTSSGTQEFNAPAPAPAAAVTRREFVKPAAAPSAATTQTKQEFGAP